MRDGVAGADDRSAEWRATLLCAAGAVAIGLSPIFVRLADVGPAASAIWRAALALPLLWLWMRWEGPTIGGGRMRRIAWIAGLFFAGDLAFWHLAIVETTLANATFITNSLPVLFIALGAFALFGERPTRRLMIGVALALAGVGLLMGDSVRLEPENLFGDVSAALTAAFFAAYALTLQWAGGGVKPGYMIFHATLATTLGLILVFPLSGEERLLPATLVGWGAVLGLGVLCQVAGQGAIVASLRVLPASFAAIVILLEPITTVALGWVWLGEAISPPQFAGGALAIAAIVIARKRKPDAPDGDPPQR